MKVRQNHDENVMLRNEIKKNKNIKTIRFETGKQQLTGVDPENFSRGGGGPTLTYNCGSAQI